MSDNLKDLKEVQVDFAIPLAGGVGSVKTVNHNPLEKDIISKLGRYTGFPFSAQRENIGIVPNGSLFWNANAMNKNDFQFVISISQNTLDGNYISRILELLVEGDLIHFKDFVGRSTTLKFIYAYEQFDAESNSYYDIVVEGFAENTNYAYQVGENEPCIIEFINSNVTQNNKIKNIILDSDFSGTMLEQMVLVVNDTEGFYQSEDEIYLFNLRDSESGNLAQFIFNSGKGVWGNIGTPVLQEDFTEILQYKNTPIRSTSLAISILETDKTINISSGTFTQPLITAVGNEGIEFEFINSGLGIITLDANGTQTINGHLTFAIPAESGCKIKSDGTNWIITNKFTNIF